MGKFQTFKHKNYKDYNQKIDALKCQNISVCSIIT